MTFNPNPRMKKTVLAIFITLAMQGCSNSTPESQISSAKQAIENSEYKKAILELKTALQSKPNDAEGRLLLGKAFLATRQLDNSEIELKKALQVGAPENEVLPALADLLVKKGKFQEVIDLNIPRAGMSSAALASLRAQRANAFMGLNKITEAGRALEEGEQILRAIPGDNHSNELELAKARYTAMANRIDDAIAILDNTLRRDPKYVEALYAKAQLLSAKGDKNAALVIYQQITNTRADEITAHLALFENHLANKAFDKADAALKAAEKIDPSNLAYLFSIAKFSLTKGELKKANEAIQLVLRAAPDHIPSVLLFAAISYRLGNYEQSLKSASQVHALYPDDLNSAMLVAANHLQRQDPKSSLTILTPLLEKYPNNARLLSLLGESYLLAKDYNKAMDYMEQAQRASPSDKSVKEGIARAYLAKGDATSAINQLEDIVTQSHKASNADIALVMTHIKQGEYDRALEAAQRFEKKMPDTAIGYNLRASALLGKGDRAAARLALEKAVAKNPTYMPAVSKLAQLDIQDNKIASAQSRYEAVLAKDASNLLAMMSLAEIARNQRDEKSMVSWLNKASKANPNATQPRLALARYYLGKKDVKQASSIAQDLINTNPGDVEALLLLSASQLANRDIDNALSTLQKAAQKAPNNPEPPYRLGLIYTGNKQPEEAKRSFEKALSINPDHMPSIDALLQMDLANRNMESALKRAQQIQARLPKSPVGHEKEGDIHLLRQQYTKAAKSYEIALSRNGDSAVLTKLHRALHLAGDKENARKKLANWLNTHPKDGAALAYAAEFNMLIGNDKEAIGFYERALQLSPANVLFLNNLALLYQRSNDKRALPTAEQAYKLSPKSPEVLDTMGWILTNRGQVERGIELIQQSLKIAPKSATVRYHYAYALAKLGNKDAAKKELQQLLKTGGQFGEVAEAKSLLQGL